MVGYSNKRGVGTGTAGGAASGGVVGGGAGGAGGGAGGMGGVGTGRLVDGPVRGRGAGLNPTNRFERLDVEVEGEHLDRLALEDARFGEGRQVATEVYRDTTKTIINRVDSEDIPFGWTVNPYRGCEHGCVYCYARPGHEYLSLSCGVDFETKLFAKMDAPELLRKELGAKGWVGEPIVMSGVTDCYQPIEAKLGITRRCLEVMAEARQPVSIVTKSRLVLRDLDLLGELARHDAVRVAVSVTTLDNKLAAKMEPRAASPGDRLWAIRRLASAGVPVMAMVAPVVPGINDREMPEILKAVADAGAQGAGYVLLRLPHQIKALFDEWLERHYPERKQKVLGLIRGTRGGELYRARWGERMRGTGAYAEQIGRTFEVFKQRYGLDKGVGGPSGAAFRKPAVDGQMGLFECE